jgi:RNA polymerase sigma-70 factor (ECF subfamily)
MTADPLDTLLEQLRQGDVVAAERVFVAYEPYLRKVVRRLLPAHLRARFDSVDVVQSVWADLFEKVRAAGWRFADAAHLQAFLVRVTRNRFLDRARQHQTSVAREQPVPFDDLADLTPSPLPQPSEVAQAEELWEQMLALCPPEHQEVLRLKRQGVPLPEIAARTGLHVGSVRRLLRTLARRLALQQTPATSAKGEER